MKIAVITVVVDDAEGIHEQKVLQGKNDEALRKAVGTELPRLIKEYHTESEFCEDEDDNYIRCVAEDLMDEDDDEVYAPSPYQGSGFVQVKYF
jgi:hypothetical protein